jgi:hypothetical protein
MKKKKTTMAYVLTILFNKLLPKKKRERINDFSYFFFISIFFMIFHRFSIALFWMNELKNMSLEDAVQIRQTNNSLILCVRERVFECLWFLSCHHYKQLSPILFSISWLLLDLFVFESNKNRSLFSLLKWWLATWTLINFVSNNISIFSVYYLDFHTKLTQIIRN